MFSKITYTQRNELLKINTPLSNAYNSVTLQEAEKRMILDGERALAASQEEPEVVATSGRTAPHALNINNRTNSNNLTNPDYLSKVGTLSSLLPGFAFFEKFLRNYLLAHFLMCVYVSSEEAEKEKRKQKI